MISLTAPDDSRITVDGQRVGRARRTVSGEYGGENGGATTRVDWAMMSLVKETIEDVASLVKGELPSFTALTARDGSRIWFDARQAVGPLPITQSQRTGGVNGTAYATTAVPSVMRRSNPTSTRRSRAPRALKSALSTIAFANR
jgi:hypothetical protein